MSAGAAARPKVSVLVVSYASAATLPACLASLRAEGHRLPLETIVLDNASPDRSRAAVATNHPEVRLIAASVNHGFAGGVNRAAELARGEYLFLLNPDAELRPGSLAELVRVLDRSPGVAIAGPRIEGADGRPELSDGAASSFWAEARQRLRAWLPGAERRSRRARIVDWVSGAALLVRAREFAAVGGMDEGFFLYFEDVDLCTRIRALGRDVLFWPRAEVRHVRGVSAGHDRARAAAAYRDSQLRYYRKHHGAEAEQLLRFWLWLGGKLDGPRRPAQGPTPSATRGSTGDGDAPRRR